MAHAIESRAQQFRDYCRRHQITLFDVQEVSWNQAEKHLIRWLKHSAGELHHSTLISTFKAWEESA